MSVSSSLSVSPNITHSEDVSPTDLELKDKQAEAKIRELSSAVLRAMAEKSKPNSVWSISDASQSHKTSSSTTSNENPSTNRARCVRAKVVLRNGSTYEGDLRNNVMHGQGTMNYANNGAKYVGSWANGVRDGHGVMRYKDGSSYDGEWWNDLRHGHGCSTYASGDQYTGSWANGHRHGHGIKTYANGEKYEGQWKNNYKHGKGTLTDAKNTIIYSGPWRCGLRVLETTAPSAL